MNKAYVIKIAVNGEITPVEIDRDNFLQELQRLVGGFIEICPNYLKTMLTKSQVMVVNDEGKLKNLPVNQTATEIAGLAGIDCIAGDAVIVKHVPDDIAPFDNLLYVRHSIIEPLEDRLGPTEAPEEPYYKEKEAFVNAFGDFLKRHCLDIEDVTYERVGEDERANIRFINGKTKRVDITADSRSAAMHDIIKALA